MRKNLFIFGTRPEAIKMAPLVKAFKEEKNFETKVCITAQHREMLDQVLYFFEITPDYDLDLMKPNQNLYALTADILLALKEILEQYRPDYLFVHGDTTTSMVAALAGFYAGCKVCHIEAGLRTGNKYSPFPEEMNRQITGRITDLHFCPTLQAKENLLKENIDVNNIFVTGNTVIDALFYSIKKLKFLERNEEIEKLRFLCQEKDILLVTCHRRENFGEGLIQICEALKVIALRNKKINIIYPVHLNPNVKKPVRDILSNIQNIKLIDPLSYPAFVWLMNKSKLIITDSGGVQEEAPSLGKPVLVIRDATERSEAVDAGTVILVGTNKDDIIKETLSLLEDEKKYRKISKIQNPYGVGNACTQIVKIIIKQ